jgi:hypothetical protein
MWPFTRQKPGHDKGSTRPKARHEAGVWWRREDYPLLDPVGIEHDEMRIGGAKA